MSKISEKAAHKFACEEFFSLGNTTVISTFTGAVMKLHGNIIADSDYKGLTLFTQGWLTKTTKDRLNGILSKWGLGVITQKKGKWYYKDCTTGMEVQFSRMLAFDRIHTPEGYIRHLLVPQASY